MVFDYLIFAVAYFVLGLFIILFFSSKNGYAKEKLLFFMALIFRILVTFVYYYLTVITQNGDSLYYHGYTQYSTGSWAGIFSATGTPFVANLTSLIYPLVSNFNNTYLMLFIPFSILGFIGSLIFYKALRSIGVQNNFLLKFFVFFLPNLVFWTSNIGKDSLVYFAIAWLFLSFVKLRTKMSLSCFIRIFLLGVLLYFIRPHIVACFLGALFFGLFLEKNAFSFKNIALFIVGFLIFNMIIGQIFKKANIEVEEENLGSYSQSGMDYLVKSGSTIEGRGQESAVERHLSGNMLLMPVYALWWLTAPYFWEARKGSHLVAVLDSLVIQYILFYLLWHIKWVIKTKGMPYKYFWLMYSLIAASIFGMGQSNFGLIVRQRLMVIPFLIILYLVIRSENKPSVNRKTEL